MQQASNLTYLKRRQDKKSKKKPQNKKDQQQSEKTKQPQEKSIQQDIQKEEEEEEEEEEEKMQNEVQNLQKKVESDDESLNSSFDSQEDLDTNVVQIEFDFLKNIDNIAMGDPIECQKCRAVLNKYSKIIGADQYLEIQKAQQLEQSRIQSKQEKIENDFVIINQKGLSLEEHEKVWRCEFCNFENKIRIEEEEIPQKDDVLYIVESLNQQVSNKSDKSDFSIVFCLDNSGSMSVTSEVKGQKVNLKHGLTEEEYNMLKQFIDQGDEHQVMPGQKQDVTYISRKQCVLAAIEQQLQDMKNEHPDRKVGVVTFSDEVVVIGDGSSEEPLVIAGDKINQTEKIENETLQKAEQLLNLTIKDSLEKLITKFDKLEEKGRTALGPALLSSITLAGKGKPGSMVVICTDGIANMGLGSLDSDQDASKAFYALLGQKAKELGIVISVITIKGEGCKIETLGQLAQETNGTVTRVDPSDISKDFANILKDEVVGTKVDIEIQLHKVLQFRNEDKCYIQKDGTFKKNIGNATINTKITFEYETKSDELLQEQKIDIENIEEIPFQTKIYYNSLKGDRYLRVLSQIQKTTVDKIQAEKEVKVNVIHDRIAQQSANMIQQGRFKNAQKYNSGWSHYVIENESMNQQGSNLEDNLRFNERNRKFKKCANKKMERMSNNNNSSYNSRSVQSNNSQEKKEKKGGFLNSVKNLFSGSKNKSKSSSCKEEYTQQDQIYKPQQKQLQQQQKQISKHQKKQYEDDSDSNSEEEEKQNQNSKQKQNKSKQISSIQEQINDEDDCRFSASDRGYSSDEDKDEAIMINYQQAKMD